MFIFSRVTQHTSDIEVHFVHTYTEVHSVFENY